MKSGKSRLCRERGAGGSRVKSRLRCSVWKVVWRGLVPATWKSGGEKLCASVGFFWGVAVYRWLASNS